MLILVFKAINGLAPNYITNLVNILSPSKYLLRRNNEILLEPYNDKTKKTLGDRAFAVAAPPCIRLARGKFELTNQDSAGGKNSTVLTSS